MSVLPMEDGIKSFGENVRMIRKAKGLSMEALANIADIELSQVSRIETGKINPKLSTILTLAIALEVPTAQLFTSKAP